MLAALLFAIATIVIHPSQVVAPANPLDLGVSFDTWYNLTLSGLAQSAVSSGATLGKFPGGAQVDIYDETTGKDGPKGSPCAGNANPLSTFDTYMQGVSIPAKIPTLIGLNYGSNPQCTAGNTSAAVGAFVSYAVKKYGAAAFPYWTIGNEQYAPGAIDCRQKKCRSSRDPNQFAANEPAFYDAAHAAGAGSVCIPIDLANLKSPWNPVVLRLAKYDCAEGVFYPQRTLTSDDVLLEHSLPQLVTQIAALRAEMVAAGRPNVPIVLAAISSALGPYGTQSQSITGALYLAMAEGTAQQLGLAAMAWHISFGSCDTPAQGGDFGPGNYGLQTAYGGAMIYSDGPSPNCPIAVARGTLLASGNALLVASRFVGAGGNVVGVTVTGHELQAYPIMQGSSYRLLVVNSNLTASKTVSVSIDGVSSGAAGSRLTYDLALYGESANDIWAPPVASTYPAWTGSLTLRLPPGSATAVMLP